MPGAVVGKNVLMTPSDGTPMQIGVAGRASVPVANTVQYQVCSAGAAIALVVAKTYTLQVIQ